MTIDQVLAEFIGDHPVCQLCGNTGIIRIPARVNVAGTPYGGRHYCVCPNGRKLCRASKQSGRDFKTEKKFR